MKTINYSRQFIYQKGFNLLELLFSMILGLLLLAVLTRLYVFQETLHRELSDISFLQDNARLANEILRYNIQTAGYAGCARLRPGLIKTHPANIIFDEAESLQILPADKSGNNAIRIKKMSTGKASITKGDLVVVADCNEVSLVYYQPNQNYFYKNKTLGKFIDETYFISDSGRKDKTGKPVLSLYQQVNNPNGKNPPRVELVDGVEKMQASFISSASKPLGVVIWLYLRAPYGASFSTKFTVALRERL